MRRVSVFIAVAFAAIFIASINTIAGEPDYESPEIDLKFNLKEENSGLSPQNKLPNDPQATQSVTADVDYDVFGLVFCDIAFLLLPKLYHFARGAYFYNVNNFLVVQLQSHYMCIQL